MQKGKYIRTSEIRKKTSLSGKGKSKSEEFKRKLSEYSKKIGRKPPIELRWEGHIKKEYKRFIHLTATKEYKEWRMAVFTRDNFTCQFCYKRGCYLEAHHIKQWVKYPELRYSIENGVCLCRECHKLTYKNR